MITQQLKKNVAKAENFRMRYPIIPDRLIWVSNVHTFDYNYRYNAISIGLIFDWNKVSCSQASF